MFTDDQDIEQALKSALNVEPSTGFEAGIRRRLGQDAPGWRVAVPAWVAAAAVLAMLAGGWYLMVRDSRVEPVTVAEQGTAPAPAPLPVPAPPSVPEAVAGPPTASRSAAVRPSPVLAARRAEPEVIVPANQLELLEQLMRDVHAGRVELPEQATALTEAPAELMVPPVLVGAIPVPPLEVTTPSPAPPSKGL